MPEQSFAYQAVASVLSVQRAVSVPLGISTPDQPNIASSVWRVAADQENLLYYFELRHPPQHILGFARQVEPQTGSAGQETHDPERRGVLGEVAEQFKDAAPFKFLRASEP